MEVLVLVGKRSLPGIFVPIIILLIAILLTSCTSISAHTGVNKLENNMIEDYRPLERFESANGFFTVNNGYIYFGRETCSTCKTFLPILTEVVSENNIMMYYFDTGYFREKSLLTESELKKIFNNNKVFSVPIIIELRDGQVYDTFTPEFNVKKDNTADVKGKIEKFLKN